MHILRGVLSIIAVGLLLYAVHYVTHRELFRINEVHIEGGVTIPHEAVRTEIERVLEGEYLGLISRRFVYTYPHEEIQAALDTFSHMRSYTLTREGRAVLVTFDEYLPRALWCVPAVCYLLSEDGFAFAEAPQLTGGSFIRYYTEGATQIERGQVIEEEVLHASEWFSKKVESELGFRIASVLYKQNRDIAFEVSGGGMFLVASGKNIETTFANLKTVLTSDAYAHIEAGNFKYVDVRFDTKIFVNEDLTDDVATSTESLPE